MRAMWLAALIILAVSHRAALASGRILVATNGAIRCSLPGQAGLIRMAEFTFGLPGISPTQRWREGSVLRTLWVTNGIHYTQSVLLTSLPADGGTSNRVLIVNLEGRNANSEYTEAFADLALDVGRQQQELELKDGTLWQLQGQSAIRIGILEVPDSGVRVSRGAVLRFSGNMPPSLDGSLTLKVPLDTLPDDAALEHLRDLEIAAALRQAIKRPWTAVIQSQTDSPE